MARRRRTRLRNYDYGTPGGYFVTLCTQRRGDVLGDVVDARVRLNPLGRSTAACLATLPDHHDLTIDTSIVMPDHVHAVLLLGLGGANLSVIVAAFKAATAREAGVTGLWQRGFYDHVVRNEADLGRVRRYIDENPVRWTPPHVGSGRIHPAPTKPTH